MKIWLLVFMFNGLPAVAGPHTLDACLAMAQDRPEAHCWNIETMQRRRPERQRGGSNE
jgi:hypothetical protein